MILSINTLLRRHRRRFALVGAVFGLACALALAHGALAGDHMEEGVIMCLAVAETAGLVLLRAARRAARSGALRPPATLLTPLLAFVAPSPPLPRLARAGPAETQVFRL